MVALHYRLWLHYIDYGCTTLSTMVTLHYRLWLHYTIDYGCTTLLTMVALYAIDKYGCNICYRLWLHYMLFTTVALYTIDYSCNICYRLWLHYMLSTTVALYTIDSCCTIVTLHYRLQLHEETYIGHNSLVLRAGRSDIPGVILAILNIYAVYTLCCFNIQISYSLKESAYYQLVNIQLVKCVFILFIFTFTIFVEIKHAITLLL